MIKEGDRGSHPNNPDEAPTEPTPAMRIGGVRASPEVEKAILEAEGKTQVAERPTKAESGALKPASEVAKEKGFQVGEKVAVVEFKPFGKVEEDVEEPVGEVKYDKDWEIEGFLREDGDKIKVFLKKIEGGRAEYRTAPLENITKEK